MNSEELDEQKKTSVASSLVIFSQTTTTSPKRHHLARRTLCAVGHKTSQILERSKSKSGVVKFGIETVKKLVEPAKSFTVHKWSTYGDPLLSALDQTLDQAFSALEGATSPEASVTTFPSSEETETAVVSTSPDDEANKAIYVLYWGRLKEKFVASQWFLRCNHILMQNKMVQAVTQKVYQPAEVFYNTVTEEFVGHASVEQYLESLTERMGSTWDDRLTPLARAFYTTAKAVTAIVGAGRFMGGAIQLGKLKIHTAIDDLLTRWDRVLGVTDDMLDQWLPEKERKERKLKQEQIKKEEEEEEEEEEEVGDEQEHSIFSMDDDEEGESKDLEENPDETSLVHKRSSEVLLGGGASTLTTRIRQQVSSSLTGLGHLTTLPWTMISQLGIELRQQLSQGSPSWFTSVNEVLLQNAVVRAISQGVIQPAEHFFKTAMDVFGTYYSEWEMFLKNLATKLGSTWDERLTTPAKSFFSLATDLTPKFARGLTSGTSTTLVILTPGIEEPDVSGESQNSER